MNQGNAIVKAVTSGDTLVLMASGHNGPPPEITVSLSSLQAPKLGNLSASTTDEPFAWQSCDFLRRLAVGKEVTFQVEYNRVFKTTKVFFGAVYLHGENLCKTVVREGWARVKVAEQNQDKSKDYEELLRLESNAQRLHKGVFSTHQDDAVRKLTLISSNGDDAERFFNRNKAKKITVVVDYVLSGSTLRCIDIPNFNIFTLRLSGVQCPKIRTNDQSPPEEYAIEAKHFTEVRLLHRTVEAYIEEIDSNKNIFGTIIHPLGNISIELLRWGLGKVSNWSTSYTTSQNASGMRVAEQKAKNSHLRLWKDWEPPEIDGERSYTGTVIEVSSGDTITVAVEVEKNRFEERKISFSSIRAPRFQKIEKSEPLAYEAKEFMRQKAIGQIVKVNVDYQMNSSKNEEEGPNTSRTFATVSTGKTGKLKYLPKLLVAEGFAKVLRHKQGGESSMIYEDLIAAEKAAEKAKKNLWAKQIESPVLRIIDLTNDKKKAQQHLSFLQRNRINTAIVEYIFSGSRYKILIPSENCSVIFSLSAVRCPSPLSKFNTVADPFSDEAKAFARRHINQQNVEVSVETMDKNGVIIGELYFKLNGVQVSFSLLLASAGLARMNERAAARLAPEELSLLTRAQEKAKNSSLGVWSIPVDVNEKSNDEEEENNTEEQESKDNNTQELINLQVCDIVSGHIIFAHTNLETLDQVQSLMQEFNRQNGTESAPTPLQSASKGLKCAALFTDDNGPSWYRAKVINSTKDDCLVHFIDYGNSETLPLNKLRVLDNSYFILPPQAAEFSLAFVKAPETGDDGSNAMSALYDLVWGKQLVAQTIGLDDQKRPAIVLFDEENPKSINETLIEEGYCRVVTRSPLFRNLSKLSSELLNRLQVSQESAKAHHKNLWRHGDTALDDDDDFRR